MITKDAHFQASLEIRQGHECPCNPLKLSVSFGDGRVIMLFQFM